MQADHVTAPSHSVVPYQSPNTRALAAAGNAAIGFGAAVAVVVGPILIRFLGAGDFSRTAMTTLASVVGAAIIGVVVTYAVKYAQAKGGDIPATVTPDAQPTLVAGTTEHFVSAAVELPALPLVDSALLVDLVNETIREHLSRAAGPHEGSHTVVSPAPSITNASKSPVPAKPPRTITETR